MVTRNADLHLRAARYTDQGGQFVTGRGGRRGGEVAEPFVGENLRMTELAGAIAGVQLTRLPGLLLAMRRNKQKVLAGIGALPGLTPRRVPDPEGDGGSSCWWFAPSEVTAERFVAALLAEGIPSARLYDGKPLYAHPAYQARRTVTPSVLRGPSIRSAPAPGRRTSPPARSASRSHRATPTRTMTMWSRPCSRSPARCCRK